MLIALEWILELLLSGNLILTGQLRLAGDLLHPFGGADRVHRRLVARGLGRAKGFRLDDAGRLIAADVGLVQSTGRIDVAGAAGCLDLAKATRLGRGRASRAFGLCPTGRGNLVEQLICGKRIGAIGGPERLILDLSQVGVMRAVLALQIEVFANRVVEYSHDARSDRLEGSKLRRYRAHVIAGRTPGPCTHATNLRPFALTAALRGVAAKSTPAWLLLGGRAWAGRGRRPDLGLAGPLRPQERAVGRIHEPLEVLSRVWNRRHTQADRDSHPPAVAQRDLGSPHPVGQTLAHDESALAIGLEQDHGELVAAVACRDVD